MPVDGGLQDMDKIPGVAPIGMRIEDEFCL
jgi:hypothetical protein